jgi:hypothetical protein
MKKTTSTQKKPVTEDEASAALKIVRAFLDRDKAVSSADARKAQATVNGYIRELTARNRAIGKRLAAKGLTADDLIKLLRDEILEDDGGHTR